MKYYIDCSVNGINVDYTQEITAEQANDYWACVGIMEAHGCEFFTVYKA